MANLMTPGAESTLANQQGARKALASSASPLIQRTTPLIAVDIEMADEDVFHSAPRDSVSDAGVQSPAASVSSPGGQDASDEFTWAVERPKSPIAVAQAVETSGVLPGDVPVVASVPVPVDGTLHSPVVDPAPVSMAETVHAPTGTVSGTLEQFTETAAAVHETDAEETEDEQVSGTEPEEVTGTGHVIGTGTVMGSGVFVETVTEREPETSVPAMEAEQISGTEPETFTRTGHVVGTGTVIGSGDLAESVIGTTPGTAADVIQITPETIVGAVPESTERPSVVRSISEQSGVSVSSGCYESNRRLTETEEELATMASSGDDLNLTTSSGDPEEDRRMTEEVVQIRQQVYEMIDADRVFISSTSQSSESSDSECSSSEGPGSPLSPIVVVRRERSLSVCSESTQSSVDELKRRLSQARLSFILSNFDVDDLEDLPLPPPPPPDWNPPLELSPKHAAPPVPSIGPRGESFRHQLTPSTIPAPSPRSPPPSSSGDGIDEVQQSAKTECPSRRPPQHLGYRWRGFTFLSLRFFRTSVLFLFIRTFSCCRLFAFTSQFYVQFVFGSGFHIKML